MSSQIWDRKIVTVSGLTGTNNVDLTPFTFSSYGATNLVRCVIDIEIIALPTVVSTLNAYGEYFSAKYFYDYLPSGGSSVIVANNTPLNSGTNIHWTPGVASGNFHVNASAQATALTWSIIMTAVIRNWLERP